MKRVSIWACMFLCFCLWRWVYNRGSTKLNWSSEVTWVTCRSAPCTFHSWYLSQPNLTFLFLFNSEQKGEDGQQEQYCTPHVITPRDSCSTSFVECCSHGMFRFNVQEKNRRNRRIRVMGEGCEETILVSGQGEVVASVVVDKGSFAYYIRKDRGVLAKLSCQYNYRLSWFHNEQEKKSDMIWT